MVNENKNAYCPDYAIPPGTTLLEVIQSKKITQSELAEKMGRPKKTINEIINGKAEITPETAIQLEHVINIPAKFWLNLEKNYRLDLARIAEAQKLAEQKEWLKLFPLKEMIKYGWIKSLGDEISNIAQMLEFFGVAGIEAWKRKWSREIPSILFRKSKKYEIDPIILLNVAGIQKFIVFLISLKLIFKSLILNLNFGKYLIITSCENISPITLTNIIEIEQLVK